MTTLEEVRRLPGLESYMEEVEVRLAAAVAARTILPVIGVPWSPLMVTFSQVMPR